MKNELGGQLVKELFGLRAKTYSYLKDNNDEDKKTECTKKCIVKKNLNLKITKTV